MVGSQPGISRVVLVGWVNSGSRLGPLLLCPGAAQGELGPAGATAFAVAAWGQHRLRGVGHVALSRRTPYRVARLKRGGQPANNRMKLAGSGDSLASLHTTLCRPLQLMRRR